jgi:hypothetical protein
LGNIDPSTPNVESTTCALNFIEKAKRPIKSSVFFIFVEKMGPAQAPVNYVVSASGNKRTQHVFIF